MINLKEIIAKLSPLDLKVLSFLRYPESLIDGFEYKYSDAQLLFISNILSEAFPGCSSKYELSEELYSSMSRLIDEKLVNAAIHKDRNLYFGLTKRELRNECLTDLGFEIITHIEGV